MKNLVLISGFLIIILGFQSCEEPAVQPGFEDMDQLTILDYIMENEEQYSSFLQVLQRGGIDKTMSAYNPDGLGYTLFLPDNQAINTFISENERFNSLEEMLNDEPYVRAFARYHVVNMAIETNDFPFGALPEYTLSDDLLTVNFVIETDTSYYKINNEAPIVNPNIEVSNGFIHGINRALTPITLTTYNWIKQHQGFSIFADAVDLTGMNDTLDFNLKELEVRQGSFTLLLEPDSVYNRRGINNLDDLIAELSPEDSDYTNPSNPLNNYVAYHVLEGNRFLDDFVGVATNYSTFAGIPLLVNGSGLDILINRGKFVYDTLIVGSDTTIIDYVGFYYDESNVITQSGAIHFIDQVLYRQIPSRATQTYEFYEEPLFNVFRQEPGTYLVEDSSALQVIKYSGTDLFFIESSDEDSPAWGNDYIQMDGDFIINYKIPRIIIGKYDVLLGAHAYNSSNAVIQIFIDGKNIGGLIDLGSGGNANNPFAQIELGTLDFTRYETHTVQVKSLIPGLFLWDYIRFEPFTNN